MRKPGLWVALWLLVALAGLGLAAATILIALPGRPRLSDAAELLISFLVALGGLAFILGLLLASRALVPARRRARLLAGDGILASWLVSPAEWHAFRAHDAARARLLPSLQNSIDLSAEPPPGGMPILIGADAIVVGDGCHIIGVGRTWLHAGRLAEIAWLDGTPGALEFSDYVLGAFSQTRIYARRVPVPADARETADRLLDHFRATISPEVRAFAQRTFPSHQAAAHSDADAMADAMTLEKWRKLKGNAGSLIALGLFGLVVSLFLFAAPDPDVPPGLVVALACVSILAGIGLLAFVARKRQ